VLAVRFRLVKSRWLQFGKACCAAHAIPPLHCNDAGVESRR
jgi:hypothetical protein